MFRTIAPFAAVLGAIALTGCSGEEVEISAEAAESTPETAPEESAARTGGRMAWTGVLGEEEFKALHELKEGEVPDLQGAMIDLAGGRAYLTLPEGSPPFPGVVVIQEWWGLNDNIKLWSDRLAQEGYAALAVDLYDGTVAGTPDEAMAAMQEVKDERALEILTSAFDFLGEDPRVRATRRASIGWCFGGGWSLRLAIAEPDLDACVIYYGRLVDDPEQLGNIGAALCGIFGERDQGIPPDAVAAFDKGLAAAGTNYEIHSFDADHAFANPSSARYDLGSAEQAWRVSGAFLARHLKK